MATQMTDAVRTLLAHYDGERPGVKASLARLLMHGRTGGSGKLVILPVDQGFEHGPGRSFAVNPPAYDPHYLFELAIESGHERLRRAAGPARRRRRPLCRRGAADPQGQQCQQPRHGQGRGDHRHRARCT